LERTRIVLIDIPVLLREILRSTLSGEPDFDVVAEHDSGANLDGIVERDCANFVIVGSEASAEGAVRSLIAANRGVRALEVHCDGKENVLYELRPHRVLLGEISTETLRRTIRTAPVWEPEP
jgi:hypothetical protein